jgi:hypothetical protein
MLKIQRTANPDVVFTVIGELNADTINELLKLLAGESATHAVALDLADLVLADRQSMRVLQECEARGIGLRNCPAYLRAWMASEEARGN